MKENEGPFVFSKECESNFDIPINTKYTITSSDMSWDDMSLVV